MNIISVFLISSVIAVTGYAIPNTITVSLTDLKIYQLGDKVEQEYIDATIAKYATGTKAYKMKRTIYCESYNTNVQSAIIKDGKKEDSWGLAQINLHWNPSVTKEQALDPEFAIKWMSDNWGTTKWYGYISKTDTCNIIYK